MRGPLLFSLAAVIVIVAASTFVAYVFFNVLESSAEASLQNWKLGGAFAGFVFTASLLTSITFQFYKQITTDQISKYRDQIMELQTKLVKGAPCPEGYVIEVDEKYKVVLSRPEEWLPKGGVLFQYVEKRPADLFPANFNLTYQNTNTLSDFFQNHRLGNFDPHNVDLDKLYENICEANIKDIMTILSLQAPPAATKEIISVDGIKSLKFILSYTVSKSDGKEELAMRHCYVLTYVQRLGAVYQFLFSDNEVDYLKSSEVFNNVLQSVRFLP